MNIQGKYNSSVTLNGKTCGIFVNKNHSIVDVREIIGKQENGTPIFSETRPQPFIEHPNSLHPSTLDYYHMLYGINIQIY